MYSHFKKISTKYHLYLWPGALMCFLFLIQSISFPVHDFGNNFFPALMIHKHLQPEDFVYNVFNFNNFVWNSGYTSELLDFYLNSPFTVTFTQPFIFFGNAIIAKFVFNLISICFFIYSIYLLKRIHSSISTWVFAVLPFLFFTAIKNQIFFGQWYFIIFSLVVIGYYFISTNKKYYGELFFAFAIMLKIFPIVYISSFLVNKQYKKVFCVGFFILLLFSISIYFTGFEFWKVYLFNVLPTAFSNNSTTDYFIGGQSIDVFLKNLFVYDAFVNNKVWINSDKLYFCSLFIAKSIIIIIVANYCFEHSSKQFQFIAACVIAVFLLQSRSATYAQIMWVIPLVAYCNKNEQLHKQIIFTLVLFVLVNYPYQRFLNAHFILQYGRLWMSLILAFLFFENSLKNKFNLKSLSLIIISLPLLYKTFTHTIKDKSTYVLPNEGQFLVHDFKVVDQKLTAYVLNKKGMDTMQTNLVVSTYDTAYCSIKNNELYFKHTKIILPPSQKAKPILVNNEFIFFLTDSHSRFGLMNLKKVSIK